MTTLSPRRLEVLRLVAEEGLSNAEIASRLHITENVVKNKLAIVYALTGCRTRLELLLRWHSGLREELSA